MKPQHVIYIASTGVVLYTWDREQYVPVSGYDLPGGDPTPLVTYLRQTPAAVIAILVDVLEEEHTRDTIARLRRGDQNAMLTRKLARLFPRTPYRTAAVQGRLPNDPQTTRILLSALTKAEHLRTLQGLLATAKLPVSTVCSPAMLSRPLLDALRPTNPADASLLVSRQREGSLRLSFFRGRYLVGSRLMRRSLAAQPGDMPRLVRQLEESVRYFDAAFAPSASNPVDVLLLCEPGIDPVQARANGTGHEGFRLHVPDPTVATKKLGLRHEIQPGNADLIFVELLRRHTPAGNFAPPTDRRYFQLHQIRTFGRVACLSLAAAGLLGASLNGVALFDLNESTRDVRTSMAEVTQLLQADPGEFGTNGADPVEMQRAVTAWHELRRHAVDPQAILGLVSTVIERHPHLQLDGLDWSAANAAAVGSGTEESSETPDPDPDPDPDPHPDPASDMAMNAEATTDPRVRVSIRGHIEPFSGNYRLAFAELQTFMDSLRTDPRIVSVKARKQPLDVNPRSTLTGEVTPTLKDVHAEFTVDLIVRLTDEPA